MPRPWPGGAVVLVLAVTALRLALLPFDRTELFLDETQYWLWGQHPAFGYYSKPPLLGWVLGLSSLVCGDSPFCIRAPGAILNGATALILGALAARLYSARAALFVAAGYVTLPIVAIGSLQIATDSVMAPFAALALAGWFACRRGAGGWVALGTGAALGLAFLAKYAAILYLPCGLLAWLILRPRPTGRALALMGLGFLIAISPNVIWNVVEGFPTLQHTMDNADWVRDPEARAGLNLAGLAGFLGAQLLVFGPVAFPVLLGLGLRWRRQGPETRQALMFALPVLALFSVQALVSHALLNWAALAYAGGVLAVMPALSRRWRLTSLAVNGALCLALPVATLFADRLSLNGDLVFRRYLGRTEMSRAILDTARTAGLATVVASDRNILADLFYTGRDSGIAIYARPRRGRPLSHYEFRYPFPGSDEPVLLVQPEGSPPPCDAAHRIGGLTPETGTYDRSPRAFWQVPGACLSRG